MGPVIKPRQPNPSRQLLGCSPTSHSVGPSALSSHRVELPWAERQEPSVLSLVQPTAHLCWLLSPSLLCRGECCVPQCWRPVSEQGDALGVRVAQQEAHWHHPRCQAAAGSAPALTSCSAATQTGQIGSAPSQEGWHGTRGELQDVPFRGTNGEGKASCRHPQTSALSFSWGSLDAGKVEQSDAHRGGSRRALERSPTRAALWVHLVPVLALIAAALQAGTAHPRSVRSIPLRPSLNSKH